MFLHLFSDALTFCFCMQWRTQGEVVFFRVIERPVLTMPRSAGLGSGTSPRFEFYRAVNPGAPL